MRIKNAVDEDRMHLSKECMVFAIASNAHNINAHPIVIWPTCSKDEIDIQMSLIQGISDEVLRLSGCPLMCWSTDGDSTRRQIFDKLMEYPLQKTSPIYGIISKLRFIDTMVGKHEETLDFDAKHLAKRMRNYFVGSNCKFGDTLLYRKDISKILELSPEKLKHAIKELVNPKDKQNVGIATEFLYTLSIGLRSPDLKNINIRVAAIADDLRHFADVIDGLLCIYSYVESSIEDQLNNVSYAAFTLLCLFRKLDGKMIPTQLYHDLQATFENIFYCASKYRKYHPDLPLFLFLLGTDVLERIFGNMRQKSKSGFSTLDMIYMARAMTEVSRILDKHPDWMSGKSKLMRRLCLDYSNPSNWDSSKLKLAAVNIPALWEGGRQKAELKFLGQDKCDFFVMSQRNVTLLKPRGKKKVGVTPLDCVIIELHLDEIEAESDPVAEPSASTSAASTTESVEPAPATHGNDCVESDIDEVAIQLTSIIDYVEEPSGRTYDNQILIDGQYYFKASVVRQLFDSSSGSSDRLKRVQSLGKYNDVSGKTSMALDNIVMIGDPVLVDRTIATIKSITLANKPVKVLDGEKLQDANVSLSIQHIELSMQSLDVGVMYVWTGKMKGPVKKKVPGSKCNLIQPTLVTVEGKSCFAFDRNFVIDFQVQIDIQAASAEEPARKKPKSIQTASAGEPARKNPISSVEKPVNKKKTRKTKQKDDDIRWDCSVCNKTCTRDIMRAHIGQHILLGNVGSGACGWCGGSCYTSLGETNKKRGTKFYKPVSACTYFWPLSKTPQQSTVNRPCTNYVVHCPVCSEGVWRYNMSSHFEERHPTHEIPAGITPTEDEITLVKNMIYK